MPLDRSYLPVRHPPSGTAQQQLAHRQAVAGGSPLHRDEAVPRLADTSDKARCDECRATFIAIGDRSAADNLARHQADLHAPTTPKTRAPTSARAREAEATLQNVADRLRARVEDGSLRPGQVVSLGATAAELGTTRHFTQLAVDQLIAAGTLKWSEATSAYSRRVIVCRPTTTK